MSQSTHPPAMQLVHSTKPVTPRDRFLRLHDVEAVTGMKKTTIYGMVRECKFPSPVRITRRLSVWPESAVLQWVQDRMNSACSIR